MGGTGLVAGRRRAGRVGPDQAAVFEDALAGVAAGRRLRRRTAEAVEHSASGNRSSLVHRTRAGCGWPLPPSTSCAAPPTPSRTPMSHRTGPPPPRLPAGVRADPVGDEAHRLRLVQPADRARPCGIRSMPPCRRRAHRLDAAAGRAARDPGQGLTRPALRWRHSAPDAVQRVQPLGLAGAASARRRTIRGPRPARAARPRSISTPTSR